MARVIWSVRALGDLGRFDAFLRSKSPRAAERAVATVQEAVSLLPQMPHKGRPVQRGGIDEREFPVRFGSGGYLIRYRVREEDIFIIAVRHFREAGF